MSAVGLRPVLRKAGRLDLMPQVATIALEMITHLFKPNPCSPSWLRHCCWLALVAGINPNPSPRPSSRRLRLITRLRCAAARQVGGKDMEAGNVSVRLHHGGPQGAKAKGEVVANILASIKERRA